MFWQLFQEVRQPPKKHSRLVMAAPSAVQDAHAALAAAGEKQARLNVLMAEEQKKLDALQAARSVKGRGRPNTAHASLKKAAESRLARLQRGVLPGEPVSMAPRTADELRVSAAQHLQQHAAAGSAPAGRPSTAAAAASHDADGHELNDDCDDDDEEDASFRQFYRVSAQQNAFNRSTARSYMRGDILRSESKIEPDNLLASGCREELIGVGPVHIFAPHLHIGLPMTPCWRHAHGWKSVDGGHVHKKSKCPARRRRYTPHTHSLGASPCLQPAGPPPPCPSPLCTDYDPESEKTGHERPASKSVDVTRACAPRYPPAAATDATPAGSAARPSPCPAVRPRPGL